MKTVKQIYRELESYYDGAGHTVPGIDNVGEALNCLQEALEAQEEGIQAPIITQATHGTWNKAMSGVK